MLKLKKVMLVKYHCLIYKSFVHSSHDDIMYVFEHRSTEHHENLKPLTCSDISHLFLKIDSYFSIVYIFWITIICQCKFVYNDWFWWHDYRNDRWLGNKFKSWFVGLKTSSYLMKWALLYTSKKIINYH